MPMTFVPSTDDGTIPWLTVENALQAWAMKGARLDSKHVWWNRQGKSGDPGFAVPNDRYVALRFTGIRGTGGNDWDRLEKLDEAEFGPNAYRIHVEGPRVGTLQVRVFNADPLGKNGGLATLDGMIAAQRLPSVKLATQRGQFGFGPITLMPRYMGDSMREKTLLDPYAVMELDVHLASSISEPAYVISFVRFNVKTTGNVTLIPPTWVPSRPARAVAAVTLGDATLVATATVV